MAQQIVQVDAFTDKPFAGNPACVCILDGPAEERWMQWIASEMNLSETAFLYPQGDGFQLRWFTPKAEVALCGHATLASAHVLWQDGHAKPDQIISFSTLSGILKARRDGNWIELDFPTKVVALVEPPEGLLESLGVTARYVGKNQFDYLVEVDSEQIVRDLKPDFGLLTALPVRGAIVTAKSSSAQFDFVSRFFAPAVGVNEDPVTGSAHCALGPYWQGRLNKSEFLAYQASERGGVMRVRVAGGRALLSGQAVTVLRCELMAH
ncbi:MAG: PhzF family phenazine biosynthesis protein [Candidatus Zixiibacteriota bacterium]